MAYIPKFALSVTICRTLNSIERHMGFLEAAPLSEEWIDAMQKKAFYSEAYSSIHMGRPKLIWNEAVRCLSGNPLPDFDRRDAQALTNFAATYEYILQFAQTEELVTENTIRHIHKLLEQEMNEKGSTPGHYRTTQNYVLNKETKEVVFTPPPAHDVSLLMRDFVAWLQEAKTLPPILIAGICVYQILYICPFMRGNGKTARCLALLLLYRNGYTCKKLYSITPYFENNLPAYYSAIKYVREHGKDQTKWLEYYTEAILNQLSEVMYEAKLILD